MVRVVYALLLHVEADEPSCWMCAIEDLRNHDRLAQVVIDVLTHRGELHRDVGVQPVLRDGIDQPRVLRAGGTRLTFIGHALAEQVERRTSMPSALSRCTAATAGIDRLAGDEPRRHAFGEPVVPHETKETEAAARGTGASLRSMAYGTMRVVAVTGASMRATGKTWADAVGGFHHRRRQCRVEVGLLCGEPVVAHRLQQDHREHAKRLRAANDVIARNRATR